MAPRDPDNAAESNAFFSYANAQLVNGTAFVPAYGPELPDGHPLKAERLALDAQARQAFEQSGYTAVAIPSRRLIADTHGAVHCLSAEIPSGVPIPKAGEVVELPRMFVTIDDLF